nr:hypothetical protein GCM10017745_73180 [Saccharothrix mutabilis subsp. capreolus]
MFVAPARDFRRFDKPPASRPRPRPPSRSCKTSCRTYARAADLPWDGRMQPGAGPGRPLGRLGQTGK